MTQHELHQNPESDETALAFAALVSGIGQLKERPSVEEQRKTLELLRGNHAVAQTEAGITAVLYDLMPEKFIGNEPIIVLRRVFLVQHDKSRIIQNYFDIGCYLNDEQGKIWTRMDVPVSREFEGVRESIAPFSDEQARLVDSQMNELERMRADGFLPDLSANLSSIFDIRTALVRRTPEPPTDSV